MKFADCEKQIPVLAPEKARVYFYRPSAIGEVVQPDVIMDGNVVEKAAPQGFFFVDRD